MKTVSVTGLTQYFRCQREYYLERVLGIKGAPYLPFIVGNAVHQFIAYWLHRGTPEGRTFFYKTEESAIKGFRLFFLREVWPEYASAFNEKEKWQALNIGIGNIINGLLERMLVQPLFIEDHIRLDDAAAGTSGNAL